MRQDNFNRSWQYHQTVVEDINKERAHTLGVAGTRLKEAVAHYRAVVEDAESGPEQIAVALKETRDAAFALIVQRECAGFRSRSFDWLRELWQVPEEVLRQI